MERWVLLAFVFGLLVMGVPFAAQNYMLSRQLSHLESNISLLNERVLGFENNVSLMTQEIAELWKEINMLKAGNSANDTMKFTFTWGPDTQKIIQGTFRLEVTLRLEGENLSMTIKANDDEYGSDYIGLVFDINQNGYIDTGDESYGLFADNTTLTPSFLTEYGFLGFPMYPPEPGPQKVTFNPKTGYTFAVQFPWVDQHGEEWNPARVLKRGDSHTGRNPLHVCFYDSDGGYVFVQFQFYILESA